MLGRLFAACAFAAASKHAGDVQITADDLRRVRTVTLGLYDFDNWQRAGLDRWVTTTAEILGDRTISVRDLPAVMLASAATVFGRDVAERMREAMRGAAPIFRMFADAMAAARAAEKEAVP